MTTEPIDIEIQTDTEEPAPPRRWPRRLLQAAHVVVLLLLIALSLMYVVDRQWQPVYGWVAGTPIERACLRVMPLIWRHKSFLERQALTAALTSEERSRATVILEKMEVVRPTHALHLKSGEELFGRLQKRDGKYVLTSFDGARIQKREIGESEIVFKQVIVYPDESLSPRDLRFLLAYENFNHYYLYPHLIATHGDFGKAFEIHLLLGALEEEYRAAFGPLIEKQEKPMSHISHFQGLAEFSEAAAQIGDFSLVNSSSFFRKSDNRLFLCEPDLAEVRAYHLFTWMPERSVTMARRDFWVRMVRHEGAHQLASLLGVFGDFENLPFWITEGMAQYCERSPFGSPHLVKLRLLEQAAGERRLLPWRDLISLGDRARPQPDESQAQLAYAQSWFLFHCLMEEPGRARFLQYLVALREAPTNIPDDSVRIIRLMNAMGTTEAAFVAELQRRLTELNAP